MITDNPSLETLLAQQVWIVDPTKSGRFYKTLYYIRDANLLCSMPPLNYTELGITYPKVEWSEPPAGYGPEIHWTAPHFIEWDILGPDIQVWETEGIVDLLDQKIPYLLLPIYCREKRHMLAFWDKCRRFGYDNLQVYFAEKRQGLMRRPYGSVLVSRSRLVRQLRKGELS
jgi:hypothetical protein